MNAPAPHDDPAVQLLLDREAIRDVILRYARNVDRRDWGGLAGCFTPDVSGNFGGQWRDNREDLIAFISGVEYFHTTQHMMGNSFIEVDGDTASLESYAMLTHHGVNDDGSEWQFNPSGGRYVEKLVRTSEGWKIRQRAGEPVWAPTGARGVASDDPAVRWLLDRAQIRDVAMQYALGVDLSEYERLAGCFAEKFVARYGDQVFEELDALIAFVRGVEFFESTTHFLGEPLMEIEGETARVETLAYITHRQTREGKKPSESMTGASRYRDQWVRGADGWRIAERNLGVGEPTIDVAPRRAPAAADTQVQGLLDRAEVEDVVFRTATGLDRRDFDGVASCFGGRTVYARDQEAELAPWHKTSHVLGTPIVRVDGDAARATTYLYRTHHVDEGDPASPWAEGAIRWEDALDRTAEGWRIRERRPESNRVK